MLPLYPSGPSVLTDADPPYKMDVDHFNNGSDSRGDSGPAGHEEPGAGELYVDTVGVVPEKFGPECRAAWKREVNRGCVTATFAHRTLFVAYGPCLGH